MTATPATLVDIIRQQYPNPTIPEAASSKQDYCVGGALVQFLNPEAPNRFPLTYNIGEALLALNPNLDEWKRSQFASLIMRANDAGLFEEAWALVEEAIQEEETNHD